MFRVLNGSNHGSSSSDEEETSSSGEDVDNFHLEEQPEVDTEYLMINPPIDPKQINRSANTLPPASLTFKDLTFSLPPTRRRPKPQMVLEPCSGHFKSGQLTAMMGPSGSGKTTLLDMLAMKKTAHYTGEVFVNGRKRDPKLFRRIAAYVGQEDLMPAHWKVKEAIRFNAMLKKTPAKAHRNVDDWVKVILQTFDLSEVQDDLIGGAEARGISGGQRRRVTLARGVAAHASLLFCDEPTSGLSATDAEVCVRALNTLTRRLGVTCIVVIHQPRSEVAELFDTLVLLTARPGRMVYAGPMKEAQAYWEARGHQVPMNVNCTDWFMDTVTPGTRSDVSAKMVAEYVKHQKDGVDAEVEQALSKEGQGQTIQQMLLGSGSERKISEKSVHLGPFAVGFCQQLKMLLARKLKLTLRNPMALGLPLAVPIIQGLIVGYMFMGTGSKPLLRQIMFSFCMLTMLCLAGTMGLIVLINERTLMKHEASEALYSEGSWSLASLLVDVPLALLGALMNIGIMVTFAQLDMSLFQTVLFWSLLLFFVYDSLFAFIGAVAADTRQAQVLASPCVSIFMLFNGFVVTKADAPVLLRWIFAISPNAYAMEAIVTKMGEDASFSDQIILSQMGFEEGNNRTGLLVLLSMIVGLRVGQLIGLKLLNNIQR